MPDETEATEATEKPKRPPPPPEVDPTAGVASGTQIRSIALYVVIAFGLAWSLALVLYLKLGPHALSNPGDTVGAHLVVQAALLAMMLCPAIAAIVVRALLVREPVRDLGLTFGAFRGYLLGFGIPLAVVVVAFAIAWIAGPSHFDWDLTRLRDMLAAGGKNVAGFDRMPRAGLHVILFVQAVVLGPVLSLPFTLGEELGWRGHLTPKLMALLGRPAGLAAAGAIWGLWHAPIILMGYDYPGHPVLGAALFVGFCILLSPLLQWLFETSGSAIAPALGHGVVNQATSYFVGATIGYEALTVGTLGWPGFLVLGIVTALVGRRFLRGRGERRRAEGSLGRLIP